MRYQHFFYFSGCLPFIFIKYPIHVSIHFVIFRKETIYEINGSLLMMQAFSRDCKSLSDYVKNFDLFSGQLGSPTGNKVCFDIFGVVNLGTSWPLLWVVNLGHLLCAGNKIHFEPFSDQFGSLASNKVNFDFFPGQFWSPTGNKYTLTSSLPNLGRRRQEISCNFISTNKLTYVTNRK